MDGGYKLLGYLDSSRPLPARPDFPLYGLDRSFHGPRWLDLWETARSMADPVDAEHALWQVALGHGDIERVNDYLVVGHYVPSALDSYRSRPHQVQAGEEAAFAAQFGALHGVWARHPLPSPSAARPAVEEASELAARRHAPPWAPVSIAIGGRTREAQRRVVDDGVWAAVVLLDDGLELGLHGRGFALERITLTPVPVS